MLDKTNILDMDNILAEYTVYQLGMLIQLFNWNVFKLLHGR